MSSSCVRERGMAESSNVALSGLLSPPPPVVVAAAAAAADAAAVIHDGVGDTVPLLGGRVPSPPPPPPSATALWSPPPPSKRIGACCGATAVPGRQVDVSRPAQFLIGVVSIGKEQVRSLDVWGASGTGANLREEVPQDVVAAGAVATAGARQRVIAARVHGRVA